MLFMCIEGEYYDYKLMETGKKPQTSLYCGPSEGAVRVHSGHCHFLRRKVDFRLPEPDAVAAA